MRRLLVDAQLPPALCDRFDERGWDAEHGRDTLGGQTPDQEIAAYAERHEQVTKDDDFLLRHPPDRSRLVWLRCGNITRGLREWLEPRWPLVEIRLDQGDKVVEVR